MMSCRCKKPSVWHPVVAVFLQFFAWGLITAPMIKILNTTFGDNALLYNGIIMGIKGFLSFLSAPLIGALSDVWGRKLFLLITAFFTCVPIPFIKVNIFRSHLMSCNIIIPGRSYGILCADGH